MAKRKFIDWDAIEPLYRAGLLSLNEICAQYEADHKNSQTWKTTVTHAAIVKKAKAKGWTRNLAGKVKERVKEKLVTGLVTGCNKGISESEIVEREATTGASVILRHRREIASLATVEGNLLVELEEIKKADKTTLKDKTIILKNIAHVRSQRIALERQAYNLNDDDAGNTGRSHEDWLKEME